MGFPTVPVGISQVPPAITVCTGHDASQISSYFPVSQSQLLGSPITIPIESTKFFREVIDALINSAAFVVSGGSSYAIKGTMATLSGVLNPNMPPF